MWQSCKKPPLPFLRVEIKDVDEHIHLGFYIGFKCWLETDGHEVIKNPEYWRFIKKDSSLDKAFRFKMNQRIWAKSMSGE